MVYNLLVFSAALIAIAGTTFAQDSHPSITEDNIQIGYVLNGQCSDISGDYRNVIARGNGVYELATGKRLFSFNDSENRYALFSPGGHYAMVDEEGIFDVQTGELVMSLEHHSYGIFSN